MAKKLVNVNGIYLIIVILAFFSIDEKSSHENDKNFVNNLVLIEHIIDRVVAFA